MDSRGNVGKKSLNFLDTTIFWDKTTQNFELEHCQKPSKSDVIMTYNKNIVPKNTKIGVLAGEIYRCKSTTTTDFQFTKALSNLKIKLLKNGYSERIISEKNSGNRRKKF